MCLAVPMVIEKINKDGSGVANLDNAKHDVRLSLIKDPKVGDYVIVHAGFAIEKLDRAEAEERLSLFKSLSESAIGQ